MEIYRSLWQTATRLKPDVWIESGYATPPLARSYAHTWRLADDYPAFSNPYPFAGLLEQVTYAILQQQILGRRPNLGFLYGGADTLAIQRQWLGAAVALQAQTVLSTDLASLSLNTTQMYREYLAALRPFSATPVFGAGIPPEAFSTTVEGTTYLGLLNQQSESRKISVELANHGFPSDAPVVAFDPQTRTAFRTEGVLSVEVGPQSFLLLVLRASPGLLWANLSALAQWSPDRMEVRVDPSPMEHSRMWLYAPGASRVAIDGVSSSQWVRDEASGLVTLDLPDGDGHSVQVTF